MDEIDERILGLEHGPLWLRRCHAEALGRSGDGRAVAPLCAAMNDWQLRDVATEALVNLGEPAVPALCGALKDRDWHVRARAAAALARTGDRRAVVPLCEALRDRSWSVRGQAVEALARMGDSRAVLPLIAVLNSGGWEIPRRAAAALGRTGDARAVLPLCEALRKGYREAAAALGQIALRDPAPALRAALPLLRRQIQFACSDLETIILRTALQRIEAATASIRDLPLPARAPQPWPQSLPLPAAPPLLSAEDLPLRAEPPAPTRDSVRSPTPAVTGTAEARAPAEDRPASMGRSGGW